jgi:hypothetical protein
MRGPDVMSRCYARIIIKCGDANYHMRLARTFSYQMRAALRTKMSKFSWRGFKSGEHVFPLGPSKMRTQDSSGGGKSSGVRLLARQAVTVTDRHVDTIDLILDGTA